MLISNSYRGNAVKLALLFFTTSFVGCGGSSYVEPPVLPVAPVSGSVKFGTDIPAGAQVTLASVDRKEGGITSTGVVQPDGSFKIGTYGTDDGAPLGDYTIVVEWYKVVQSDAGTSRGPNVIPAKFGKAETSPLKVTVKEGANEVPPIAIPKS